MKKIETHDVSFLRNSVIFGLLTFVYIVSVVTLNVYVNNELSVDFFSVFLSFNTVFYAFLSLCFGVVLGAIWRSAYSVNIKTRMILRSLMIAILAAHVLVFAIVSGTKDEGLGIGLIFPFLYFGANIIAILLGLIVGAVIGEFKSNS